MSTLVETVVTVVGTEYQDVIERLLRGVTQRELDARLHTNPKATPEIQRMNFLAFLKYNGAILEKRGRGPDRVYRLIDWRPPDHDRTSVDRWPDDRRDLLEQIRALPRVPEDSEWYYTSLKSREIQVLTHSCSWAVVRTYLISTNDSFVFQIPSLTAILISRFKQKPRWKVMYLSGAISDLSDLVQIISQVSLKPVTVVGLQPHELHELSDRLPGTGVIEPEAIYDLDDILSSLDQIFNARALRQLRARDRDCSLSRTLDPEAARRVIDLWRAHNEPKQRQLSILRDYLSLDIPVPLEWFLGYRDGHPVAVVCSERCPWDGDWAFEVVSKALNYVVLPGGKPGISDWITIQELRGLRDLGVRYLNAGSLNGGTPGLKAHKTRYTRGRTLNEIRFQTRAYFRP